MTNITTCLINQCSLLNEGIKSLLKESGYNPLLEVRNIEGFLKDRRHHFKLIILCSEQIKEDPDNTIRLVKDHACNSKIIILANDVNTQIISSACKAGIDGYIYQNISTDAFVASINLVIMGQKIFPANIVNSYFTKQRDEALHIPNMTEPLLCNDLSERERDTIQFLAKGLSNKMIANNLNITESTVKIHLKTILRKLGMNNRTQAAIWAIKQGFPTTALIILLMSDALV